MSIPPIDHRPLLPMPPSVAAPPTMPEIVMSSNTWTLPPAHKRTRVLLSCAPCRFSKQKCDRQQPCTNCIKKSREGQCTYVPKPEKVKPERSMAARLRRLEGMVREVMHTQQPPQSSALPQGTTPARTVLTAPRDETNGTDEDEEPLAQVVVGKGGQGTYIGATHFMAMLDDIEDLKSYFDDDDDEMPEDSSIRTSTSTGAIGLTREPSYDTSTSPEIFMFAGNAPTCKQDLIDMLPPREVVDTLIERYFSARSPSHHCVHKPTFDKQLLTFYLNPTSTSPHWLSLLYTILSLGTLLSNFTSSSPSPQPNQFNLYRSLSLQSLFLTGLSCPSLTTLQSLLLFCESEFLVNRKTQMNCYLLISLSVRLMLRMGLHRDPANFPHISPFDGEMRRRLWHVACQFDLLVSFHLGLPSMVDSLESDTLFPKNLPDSDISPSCVSLPSPRPDEEYTPLTYPIWKSSICQVFGLVAKRSNSLKLPNYAEVMALDKQLEERWAQVPKFMRHVTFPLSSNSDSPHMLNHRFGLVSLYQKSRCVLHRRYLQHSYSRRICLEAAVALLDYQEYMHLATLPGGMLRESGWFITALAIHDFLLGAMVVYLVLLNSSSTQGEESGGGGENGHGKSRKELLEILKRSHRIWTVITRDDAASLKAVKILGIMLRKLREKSREVEQEENDEWEEVLREKGGDGVEVGSLSLSVSDEIWDSEHNFDPAATTAFDQTQVPLSRQDLMPASTTFDAAWLDIDMGIEEMSWRTFDDAMSGQNNNIIPQDVEDWIDHGPLLPDVSLIASFGLQGPFV
ncbi:fungal-specific transcription factor domain-containing protein [Podospora fimiseda]|uniref:Fungal-specific transcription factor domain-containing protein n=1 Tax=Podospora fimiseda TaxID=252190 RepID=A0AAN7BKY9_9PEZI|nr:fungal-specific transcription factor domain-containing protein [Podospora fimiseda]